MNLAKELMTGAVCGATGGALRNLPGFFGAACRGRGRGEGASEGAWDTFSPKK